MATAILTTARLSLRCFTADDAGWLLGLVNDPAWLANIGDRGVRTEADAAAYIEDRLVAGYRAFGFGFWAVERRNDGVLLGMCGMTRREGLPDPDLGFALLPGHRGRGYAREAALACRDHAAAEFGLRRLLAITTSDNEPSIRVLAAIGFRPALEVRYVEDGVELRCFAWTPP